MASMNFPTNARTERSGSGDPAESGTEAPAEQSPAYGRPHVVPPLHPELKRLDGLSTVPRPAEQSGEARPADAAEDEVADEEELPLNRFLDREQSWLAFNERVLELAEDTATPLLERANFLAIFASNLDEFFMVRVAGLKRRITTGVAQRSASGLPPTKVLENILSRARELMARHAACFQNDVAPALAEEDIHIIRWNDLTEKEQARLFTLFRNKIFPVLTPLAVDPAHPFPYISGLSLNLAVTVRNPVSGHDHFARVKVPPILSRFLEAARSASSRWRTSSPRTWRSSSPAWRCWTATCSG